MSTCILPQHSGADNAESETRDAMTARVVECLKHRRPVVFVVMDGEAVHVHKGRTPRALDNSLRHYNGHCHAFLDGQYVGELNGGLAASLLYDIRRRAWQ